MKSEARLKPRDPGSPYWVFPLKTRALCGGGAEKNMAEASHHEGDGLNAQSAAGHFV